MRLWSLDPALLDRRGLVACWREALLAQKVLQGLTVGYKNHPQLDRFRDQDDPVISIGAYLAGLANEADSRGYSFNRSLIVESVGSPQKIAVTQGQLTLEAAVLLEKVKDRDADWYQDLTSLCAAVKGGSSEDIEAHPLFDVVVGDVEPWEKATAPPSTT